MSSGIKKLSLDGGAVPGLTIRNDRVFADVLKDVDICMALIADITGKAPTSYTQVEAQVEAHTIAESDIAAEGCVSSVFDAIVRFGEHVADFEIQRRQSEFPVTRARIYSSLLDAKYFTKAGNNKYNVGENYVVVFTEYAAFGHQDPIQHYVMLEQEVGYHLDDGRHIIFINYLMADKISKERRMLRAICQHLALQDEDSVSFRKIDKRLEFLLGDKERVGEYMTFERELEVKSRIAYNDGKADGREEGRAEGREEGKTEMLVASIRGFYRLLLGEGYSKATAVDKLCEVYERDVVMVVLGLQ